MQSAYTNATGSDVKTPAEKAAAYGEVGKRLFAAELTDAAESFFAAARALDPADMRWPYYQGYVAMMSHRPEAAVTFFEQAQRLQPKHVPTLVWLADTQLTIGRASEAERQAAKAADLQPSSVAAWFARGRAALALRDYSNAVTYLERALALSGDNDAIHYQLGLAYRALGNTARAEQHLKRRADAATIVPEDPLLDSLRPAAEGGAGYLARGLDAMERRDWTAALADLRKASEAAPRDAGVRVNLGTALFLSGDRAGARREFQEAVRLAPDFAKAHYTLGLVAESDRRDSEAIEHFTRAITLDPNYVEAEASLADALRRGGRAEASLPRYLKVLSLNPAASQARFGYSMALVALGRYAEARDVLQQATALHPDQPGFTHALARLLAAAPDDRVRDGREAARLTDTLLRTNRSWTLFETRAMAAAELGQFDDAVRWQLQAIEGAGADGQAAAAEHLRDNLAGYRNRQPCRQPWRRDDPVFAPRPSNF